MVNSKSHRKGLYTPINKQKYVGDILNIRYLSSWENQVCKWADLNPDIEYWGSEINIVKYLCPSDGQLHNYYIDFTFKYKNGKVLLVEVKPANQTILPKSTKGKKKSTLLTENLAFMKNVAKWRAGHKYAEENGAKFVIWTQESLRKMGINVG